MRGPSSPSSLADSGRRETKAVKLPMASLSESLGHNSKICGLNILDSSPGFLMIGLHFNNAVIAMFKILI